MQTWLRPLLLLALVFSGASGCAKPMATTTGPVATCTKAGEQCQYADGKIGLCTARGMDSDGGAACLTCMSLH